MTSTDALYQGLLDDDSVLSEEQVREILGAILRVHRPYREDMDHPPCAAGCGYWPCHTITTAIDEVRESLFTT